MESTHLVANGIGTFVCKDCITAHHQHQQQLAVVPRSFQCIKCQEIFATEAEIQAHVASHLLAEGSLHPCRLCGRQFDTPLKLQTHLIEHTFAGCPAYACYLCGCLFTAAVNLQRHMFEQHGAAAESTLLRPYDCSQCHLKFFFRAELENHLLSHVEQQIQQQQEEVNRQQQQQQRPPTPPTVEEEEEDILLEDEDDNISVTSSSSPSSEITLSDAQKAANAVPSVVKDCSVDSLSEDSSSSSSIKMMQQQQPPFRCDKCDQSFPCLSNLQGHIRIHTQGRRLFTCPETSCGKEFALRRNLHIHMRSHTGDRPYSCPVCPKRFARKENRKAHLKLHSGVKPFSCDVCGKSFARKSHLTEHGRTHNNNGLNQQTSLDSVTKSRSQSSCSSVSSADNEKQNKSLTV